MKSLVSLSLLLFFYLFDSSIYGQHYWKYPITPGSEGWEKLKSEKEIISVQQIPEDVLKK